MFVKLIVIVQLIIISTFTDYSQTIVGDTVRGIWSKSASPYIIKHNVYVDGILNIEPGVVVLFNGYYKLYSSDGTINAKGTIQDSIYFTSTLREHRSWWGISARHINKTVATPSTFKYCVIEYSDFGLGISRTISNGISGGDTISNCAFRDNGIGAYTRWDNAGKGYVISSAFYRNDSGFYTDGYFVPALIESCYFHHNNFGIYLEGEGGTYFRNIITDNDSIGIKIESYFGNHFEFGDIDKCNKIYNNPVNIMLGDGLPGNGKPDLINVTNNYWGSVDNSIIKPTIKGRISYIPYTDENCTQQTTSINENNVPYYLSAKVYPNPVSHFTNAQIDYSLSAFSEVKIEVYDVLGRLYLQENIGWQQPGSFSYQLPEFKPGMYFVKIIAGTQTKIVKLLVRE